MLGDWLGMYEFHGKMMTAKLQPLVQIQSMRVLSLITRIKMQLVATALSTLSDHPIHERTAVTGTTLVRMRNQIVDVEHSPPRQKF